MIAFNEMFAISIAIGLLAGVVWIVTLAVAAADRGMRRGTRSITGKERGFLTPPPPPPPPPVNPQAMYSGMDIQKDPSTGKYEVALTLPSDFYQALRDAVPYVSGSTAAARRQRAFSKQWAEATEPEPGKRHIVLNETSLSYLAFYEFSAILHVWSHSNDPTYRTFASNGRVLHQAADSVRRAMVYEAQRKTATDQ